MGGNIVLTYKRKRLFPRTNEPPSSLHSVSPGEALELKDSADSDEHEPNAIIGHILQKPTEEVKASPDHCEDEVGMNLQQTENFSAQHIEASPDHCEDEAGMNLPQRENVSAQHIETSPENFDDQVGLNLPQPENNVAPHIQPSTDPCEDQVGISLPQCENCSSQHVEHAQKRQKLFSTETEEKKNSATENHTEKSSALEGESQSVKSQFHTWEDPSVPATVTSEETNIPLNDENDTVRTNLYNTVEVTSTLLTFSRRSKLNRINPEPEGSEYAVTSSSSTNPVATSFRMQLMNEIDVDTKEALFSSGNEVDDHPRESAEDAPLETDKLFQDSVEEVSLPQEQGDVQDNYHGDQLHAVPDTGDRTSGTEDSVKKNSFGFLNLSVHPPDPHGVIDDSQLVDYTDENNVTGGSMLHLSLDSLEELKDEIFTLRNQNANSSPLLEAVEDKGKGLAESSPELIGTSSERNYLQLFPETSSKDIPSSSHNNENPDAIAVPKESNFLLKPLTSESLYARGPHLQPEQTMNTHAPHLSLYGWPSHPQQSRDASHNLLQSNVDTLISRNRMLDSLLGRAGVSRGNRINEIQSSWLEEELDCLWVGVRRHGRGNWHAMLKDRRLHFSPFKTPWDLAQRWEEEQFRLLHGIPAPQGTYSRPLELLQPRVDFNAVHEYHGKKVLPANFMVERSRQLHNPATNSGTFNGNNFRIGSFNPFEGSAMVQTERPPDPGASKESLPQWMREAAGTSFKPTDATPSVIPSACVPGMQSGLNNNSFTTILRNVEMQSGMRASRVIHPLIFGCPVTQVREQNVRKQDELIVIPSDDSSEETISDDRNIKK